MSTLTLGIPRAARHPRGIALYQIPKTGGATTLPSALSLLAMVVAILLVIAMLGLTPTRIGIRRPIAEALHTETT